MNDDAPTPEPDGRTQFLAFLQRSLDEHTFLGLTLSKYHGPEAELKRIAIRPVVLKGRAWLSCVAAYTTRDITQNITIDAAVATIADRISDGFRAAHLHTTGASGELAFSRRGRCTWRCRAATHRAPPAATHDRAKQYLIDPTRPFLAALGVTDEAHRVLPSMSRKWKQINKFLEIFQQAFDSSQLAMRPVVRVVDFGSGKGYLTFAVHDYLHEIRQLSADVTGIELREALVQFCNAAVAGLALDGLRFRPGDLDSYAPEAVDVMIALHACDTATDLALGMGIRAGADIILCAPCCHKEIRPQMSPPPVLRPMLRFGIQLGQEAEMVTDTIRAMLLEAHGYKVQLLEFIALEHTPKNKMLLAVKRVQPLDAAAIRGDLDALKAFYGIRHHCLETLLAQSSDAAGA